MIRTLIVVALAAFPTATAFAADANAVPAQIAGTVTYRQRVALPPNSRLHVQLQDVSRPAAATTVAETSMLTGSAQVPLAFALSYVPAAIDANHTYAVRATLDDGGVVIFLSPAGVPVITSGAPLRVDLVLVPAGAAQVAAPSAAAQVAATFEGSHWKLTELGGAPVTTLPSVPAAFIEFDDTTKRIAALGGCNRLMGSYAMHGKALSISSGGITMATCPEPLGKQETAFTDALRATKGYRLDAGTLELLDGDKVLARFVAVPK